MDGWDKSPPDPWVSQGTTLPLAISIPATRRHAKPSDSMGWWTGAAKDKSTLYFFLNHGKSNYNVYIYIHIITKKGMQLIPIFFNMKKAAKRLRAKANFPAHRFSYLGMSEIWVGTPTPTIDNHVSCLVVQVEFLASHSCESLTISSIETTVNCLDQRLPQLPPRDVGLVWLFRALHRYICHTRIGLLTAGMRETFLKGIARKVSWLVVSTQLKHIARLASSIPS